VQRDAAWKQANRHGIPRDERLAAERKEREARREIDLLLNEGDFTEADFYPYRYFAGEGFLPGYNFPRLPMRAMISSGSPRRDGATSLDRPRFRGLREFGPQNVIYHEGRKHRIVGCVVPVKGLESRLTSARICSLCGYIHPDSEATQVEVCVHCGTGLDAATSEFPQALFDQPAARTTRWTRITSDEEERSREGYHITTHYRFSPDESATRRHVLDEESGDVLLDLLYAPSAQLWRINHGWLRSSHRNGFTLDCESGRWGKHEDGATEDAPDEPLGTKLLSGVRPYVTDTRNLLLLRPAVMPVERERFLTTLAYALQPGI